MLNLVTQGAEHIYLACGPADFRKQIGGLAAVVSLRYHLDPYSPVCVFLSCNRKKNCIKALHFDKDGFLLATKKLLPEMTFQWPKSKEEIRDITPQQARWLLEGLSIEQKKAHKTVRIRPEDTCF